VKKSIERLVALEKARDEGRFELITKKEALDLTRKIEKMDRSLGGIKTMKALPSVIFVIDPKREHIAIREATKLGIPVVGLCDTNCDPNGIKHVIPGNDDAIKSIRLFTTAIADAVAEGGDLGRGNGGGYEQVIRATEQDVEIVRRRGGEVIEDDADIDA
jgi:small subunit ribosomal protein S2